MSAEACEGGRTQRIWVDRPASSPHDQVRSQKAFKGCHRTREAGVTFQEIEDRGKSTDTGKLEGEPPARFSPFSPDAPLACGL